MARFNLIYKVPNADLRRKYRKWMEWSLIIALLFTVSLFYAFQRFESSVELNTLADSVIELENIPITEQLRKPPPPERPKIPVEADDEEDVPEDLFIDDTPFDPEPEITELPPPPPEEEPTVEFYALSEKPVEIKRVNPVYPELARRAGIEGRVVVKALINTKGDVEEVAILKSHPLLDQAAIDAARQFKFKPGKQRDRYVKVWMSIPFTFELK